MTGDVQDLKSFGTDQGGVKDVEPVCGEDGKDPVKWGFAVNDREEFIGHLIVGAPALG